MLHKNSFANPESCFKTFCCYYAVLLRKKELELFVVEENQRLNVELEMWSHVLRCGKFPFIC